MQNIKEAQNRLEDALLDDDEHVIQSRFAELLEAQQQKIDALMEENLKQKELLSKNSCSQEPTTNCTNGNIQTAGPYNTSSDTTSKNNRSCQEQQDTFFTEIFGVPMNQKHLGQTSCNTQFEDPFKQTMQPLIPSPSFNQISNMRNQKQFLNFNQQRSNSVISDENPFASCQQQQLSHSLTRSSANPFLSNNPQAPIQQQSSSVTCSSANPFRSTKQCQQSILQQSDYSNSPHASFLQKSSQNLLNDIDNIDRPATAPAQIDSTKDIDFSVPILPYNAWLKKHNMKENKTCKNKLCAALRGPGCSSGTFGIRASGRYRGPGYNRTATIKEHDKSSASTIN